LRKASLDELPQLWNVLHGDMSLVGPRPYLIRESKEVRTAQSEVLRIPPGITGAGGVSAIAPPECMHLATGSDGYSARWTIGNGAENGGRDSLPTPRERLGCAI
jgi:lipopolysaccharide/colanic/teichoic acid biosynthesis glycosyltransferase